MDKNSKIFVAGHRGLVGSAIVANLNAKGYGNIIVRNRSELNLLDQSAVSEFFEKERPDIVFLAAAKVGGIVANNNYRADFIYENLQVQNNVIHSCYVSCVKKLMFLGSTCIYPKNAKQPMQENSLLTSELEYTNEPYAIAKIAGIKMCESYNIQYGTNFLSVMPTNLYGPNDNFDLEKSHVLPALIRKIHLAKLLSENRWKEVLEDLALTDQSLAQEYLAKFGVSSTSVEVWGSGRPMREFLWSEDMADACVFLMENVNFSDLVPMGGSEIKNSHINIGTGSDISISDLAHLIRKIVDFKGEIVFNSSMPDGTFKKLTDVTKLHNLGWHHSTELEVGIARLYSNYQSINDG